MARWKRILAWLRLQSARYHAILCVLGLRTCKECRELYRADSAASGRGGKETN